MPWEVLKIEETLKKALVRQFQRTKGEELYSDYVQARKCLIEDILPEIRAKVPELTDHGPAHIANVLNNIDKLLDGCIKELSGIELYCLCLSALFHDVGNLFGREEHNRNINEIYDHVRRSNPKYRQEKYIVLRACEAHCGLTSDGSMDTLKIVDEHAQLCDEKVRLRKIAALLRFADELAEGPQRTSAYMVSKHGYSETSEIYHKYATITSINIDRGGKRIALTYNIGLNVDNGAMTVIEETNFRELLNFIYKRTIKLEQERKYTKFYCDYLEQFKETQVQFNFWLESDLVDMGLLPVTFSDIVIPGDDEKTIPQRDGSYEIETLLQKIRSQVCEVQ